MKTAADNIDAALDAALKMTFPASDPIAVFIPISSENPVAPRSQGDEVSDGSEHNL